MSEVFSAAPGILIAVPQLDDPNFHRAVVAMIEHDHQGALGLVINFDLPHTCAEVATGFDLPWPGGAHAMLRRGGPVEPQSLWMLHDDGWCFDETMRVADAIAVSRSREALTRMCEGGESKLRLYVGYAGWGPGQLEAEIARGSWIVGEMDPAMVFEWDPKEVWARSLARLGIDPAHLVDGAGTVQ
jgi:putative transcriptional regulator